MISLKATYHHGHLILESPLDLAEGAEVELLLDWPGETDETAEQQAWEQACHRLEEEWGVADAAYDDWRRVYAISR